MEIWRRKECHRQLPNVKLLFPEMLSRKGRKRKYYEVDGGWKCRSCEAVFSEKSMFKNHNDVCGQTSFKCGQCQTTFDDIELLKEHLATTVVGMKATFGPLKL